MDNTICQEDVCPRRLVAASGSMKKKLLSMYNCYVDSMRTIVTLSICLYRQNGINVMSWWKWADCYPMKPTVTFVLRTLALLTASNYDYEWVESKVCSFQQILVTVTSNYGARNFLVILYRRSHGKGRYHQSWNNEEHLEIVGYEKCQVLSAATTESRRQIHYEAFPWKLHHFCPNSGKSFWLCSINGGGQKDAMRAFRNEQRFAFESLMLLSDVYRAWILISYTYNKKSNLKRRARTKRKWKPLKLKAYMEY